jgi:DNA-binding NarL/FixJ family response regulator
MKNKNQVNKRHCKQCGVEIGKGKSFCKECRPKTASTSNRQENKNRQEKKFQDRWAIIPKRIGEGRILNEIARELHLSRQRISQIVKKLGLSQKYREQRFPNLKNII